MRFPEARLVYSLVLQLNDLLKRAREAIQHSKALVDKDQLDAAYVQYLRASEITVNVIPRHPDYRIAINQRPGWYDQFSDLMLVSLAPAHTHMDCRDFRRQGVSQINVSIIDFGAGFV